MPLEVTDPHLFTRVFQTVFTLFVVVTIMEIIKFIKVPGAVVCHWFNKWFLVKFYELTLILTPSFFSI